MQYLGIVLDEKVIIERIGRNRNNKDLAFRVPAAKIKLTVDYLSRNTNARSAPHVSTLGRNSQSSDIDISYTEGFQFNCYQAFEEQHPWN